MRPPCLGFLPCFLVAEMAGDSSEENFALVPEDAGASLVYSHPRGPYRKRDRPDFLTDFSVAPPLCLVVLVGSRRGRSGARRAFGAIAQTPARAQGTRHPRP